MTVHSRQIPPDSPQSSRRPPVRPYSSHVISARELAAAEPRLRRFLAVVIWFFSWYGNVLAFGGGWLGVLTMEQTALGAVIIALVYQAICTVIQFVTCARWSNPLYLIALTASVVPSFVGYRPYVAIPLTARVTSIAGDVFATPQTALALLANQPQALGLAVAVHAAMLIAFILVDIIPERVFVQH